MRQGALGVAMGRGQGGREQEAVAPQHSTYACAGKIRVVRRSSGGGEAAEGAARPLRRPEV